MDPRSPLLQYIDACGGKPQAAKVLDLPYSTLAAICNGTRGVGKDLARRLEEASGGQLNAQQLVWIRPAREAGTRAAPAATDAAPDREAA